MTVRTNSGAGRKPAVAVFGATGHTGRFVVSELLGRGITPVAIARDEAKLAGCGFADHGIEVRVASIEDGDSLDHALAGVVAVANCAGPFLDTAETVGRAALRAAIHYLDVTAEQESARRTFETFDAPARGAGVVVMPAMGFFGGFADLLVTTAMDDWNAVDEIEIGIALDSWHPTRGTRITGQKNTARRIVVANGQPAPLPSPASEKDWDFPEPFARQKVVELPFSEIIVIARHTRTGELHTYLNHTALCDVRDPTTPAPEPADGSGRSAQAFLVEAIVRKGSQARRIVARGSDIYAFSASFVCEAVERLVGGQRWESGAVAPGAVFQSGAFLNALSRRYPGFEVASK